MAKVFTIIWLCASFGGLWNLFVAEQADQNAATVLFGLSVASGIAAGVCAWLGRKNAEKPMDCCRDKNNKR